MFSTLRTRFGIPGVISVIALVFAMFGGAYAASNSSGGGKATASKAKQGPRGKMGKTGPAGPQGPAGTKGDTGAAGANGSNGTPGADGKSVTGEPIAAGGACGTGVTGVKYTLNATATNVCNGKNGKDGETGFTETLPEGATETGFWNSVSGPELLGSPSALATISFNIPTPTALEPIFNDVDYTGTSGDDCPGSAADPQAAEGKLCVYTTGTIQGTALGAEPTFMTGVIGSTSTPQGTGMIWSEALKLGGGMPAEQVAFGTYAASP